jgi:hypothetical protein
MSLTVATAATSLPSSARIGMLLTEIVARDPSSRSTSSSSSRTVSPAAADRVSGHYTAR